MEVTPLVVEIPTSLLPVITTRVVFLLIPSGNQLDTFRFVSQYATVTPQGGNPELPLFILLQFLKIINFLVSLCFRFINMKMSVPIGEMRIQYLVRRPKLIKNSWYILLKPFQESVWIFVIITFLWVTSILWLYCSSRFIKKTSYEASKEYLISFNFFIVSLQGKTSF